MKVLRKNKSYDKRKLVIIDDQDKKIVEVTVFLRLDMLVKKS